MQLRESPDVLWEAQQRTIHLLNIPQGALSPVYRTCDSTMARGIIQDSSHPNYGPFSRRRSWERYHIGTAKTEKPGCY